MGTTKTGSGSGVKSFIDKTVDFGASDKAMTPEEIGRVGVDPLWPSFDLG